MKNSYKRREAYHRDQIHKSNNKGYGQTILAGGDPSYAKGRPDQAAFLLVKIYS